MPVTVGATLSGVTYPDRSAGLQPFKSSAGNIYFFGRDSTNTGHIEPHKAADPIGGSFTAQTTKLMSSAAGTAIEAAAACQDGDIVHVVAQIGTGAVYYNQFDMATDTWVLTTSELAQSGPASGFAPTLNATFVSLMARSNGNAVIAYAGGVTVMAGSLNTCYYRIRTGTNTYGTATRFDGAGSVDWQQPLVIPGASDRAHFFFKDHTVHAVRQRTLSSADALETLAAAFSTSSTNNMPLGVGTSYVDGATTKVRISFALTSGGVSLRQHIARLDSADAPTVSVVSDASDLQGTAPAQPFSWLASNGVELHLFYIRSADADLYHDMSSDGGATWGVDTNEFVGSVNRISTGVYDRSGMKLGMVIDDAGTLKYAEIEVTSPDTEPPAAPLGLSATVITE